MICARSPDVGDIRGDRGPDKLVGVGILFEVMEEVRSCFTAICGTCIDVFSAGIGAVMACG
jgi:hypothetical protein